MDAAKEVDVNRKKRQREEEKKAKELGATEVDILGDKLEKEYELKLKADQENLRENLKKLRGTLFFAAQAVFEAAEKEIAAYRKNQASSKLPPP